MRHRKTFKTILKFQKDLSPSQETLSGTFRTRQKTTNRNQDDDHLHVVSFSIDESNLVQKDTDFPDVTRLVLVFVKFFVAPKHHQGTWQEAKLFLVLSGYQWKRQQSSFGHIGHRHLIQGYGCFLFNQKSWCQFLELPGTSGT